MRLVKNSFLFRIFFILLLFFFVCAPFLYRLCLTMYKWVYILLTFFVVGFSKTAHIHIQSYNIQHYTTIFIHANSWTICAIGTIFLITHSGHNLTSYWVGRYLFFCEHSCTTVVLHCLSLYFVLILIMIYRSFVKGYIVGIRFLCVFCLCSTHIHKRTEKKKMKNSQHFSSSWTCAHKEEGISVFSGVG